MKYLVLLLLAGCTPAATTGISPTLFRSPCGLDIRGYTDGGVHELWTQASVAAFEDRILDEFQFIGDARFKRKANVCKLLNGWQIWLHPQGCWVDRWGREVCGLTDCLYKLSQVGAIPGLNDGPDRGSLAHELAHAVQRCSPVLPVDPDLDEDHANWTRDGIYDAIGRLVR